MEYQDIEGDFAEDIQFVITHKLLSGIGKKMFGSNRGITLSELLDAFGVLSGIDLDKTRNYETWAKGNGIVGHVITSVFAPDRVLTRQEIAAIMVGYAHLTGFSLPEIYTETTFTDGDHIAGYAKAAIKIIQKAGVMNGKDEGIFDPTAKVTRAEISQILHRYIMLTIFPESIGKE